MRTTHKMLCLSFAALGLLVAATRHEAAAQPPLTPHGAASPFFSFRDIPGVTAEETAAIESLQKLVLQKEQGSFVYGVDPTTEAFLKENGEVGGYAALFCQWLTNLFGIRFQPEIFARNDLLGKLYTGELDFAGTQRVAEERGKHYYTTEAIAERQYQTIRLVGSSPLVQIARTRPLRHVFLKGASVAESVAAATEPGSYESIWAADFAEAYRILERGDADAFIGDSVALASFDAYGDVRGEDFVPLISSPVSMVTTNPALEPIISVVTRALRNGARPHLNQLYNRGYEAYRKNRFFMRLTEEEKAYLRNTTSVPLAARYFNYPVDFYNAYEDKWEGIAFDVLREVEGLTGLTFEVVNGKRAILSDLFEMVYEGKAHIMPELLFSRSRAERVIWTRHKFLADQLTLLSKVDYPNVSINEVPYKRIGLIKNTVRAEMFRSWFPSASHITEFDTDENAMFALERNEIDLVMSSKHRLLSFLKFYELSVFKANVLFNYPYESTFGFPKDQTILCSIMDKALPLVDTYAITEQWMTKTYDYRARLMEAQRPWLVGATVLSLVVLSLLLVLFYLKHNEGKRLKKLVTEKTATLTTILDGTPDLIFSVDLDSCFTEFNISMERHFNRDKADILGKDLKALGVPPDLSALYTNMNTSVFNDKQALTFEEFIPSHDGEMMLFETIKSPVIQDGQVAGLVGMARNITQRKAMEEALKKASAEAKSASEAKSRFVAAMSHEMRTPMNAIVGLTGLMLEDNIPDDIKDTLRKINIAGNTLMGLVSDVLDISKIEAGKLELTPVQYDVASLLNDVITLNMIRIEGKPISFRLDVHQGLPRVLFGDDQHIKQILNNLLSNAFKYTKAGSVVLGATARYDGDGVLLSFHTSDTGIGIRQEDMAKLFADFSQVDTRANRAIEGTGLGLSLTKKFVELMGGEISAESEYGQGSTFRVRIRQGFVNDERINEETLEKLREFRYAEMKKRDEKLVRPDLGYARVLVVDDFPTNLDVAAGMLRKYKLRVDRLTNGRDVVDRIAAGEPVYDAVFMDHMMPGMDGLEATTLIRALGTEYAKKLPIIALTANAVAGNEKFFLENGFNAFLPKPFNAKTLDAIVQRWVRDKSKEQQ